MSFSTQIKEEVTRIRQKEPTARLAQLSGLTLTCGSLRFGGRLALVLQTESLAVAKHITALATSLYQLDVEMELKEQEHRKRPLFVATLSGGEINKLLTHTGVISTDKDGSTVFLSEIPKKRLLNEDCKRAFLRGCFLGSGSCINPRRSYHMEIVCIDDSFAEQLCALLTEFTIQARCTIRKNKTVVYVKDGDSVTGFLALIGANVGAMELENVRVEKEMRNYINRTSNCESANMDKSALASARQYQAIMKIMGGMDISKLPRPLLQAAQLRLSHPEATLAELAQMADIQKSGMNHRLERLMKIAKELE